MITSQSKYIKPYNFKRIAEIIFLLSPLVLVLGVMFNFTDTKWLLSRLIPLVFLYSLFFYPSSIKENSLNRAVRPLFIISVLLFVFSTIAHLFRGDDFGFPRTVLLSLLYLAFVPWRLISARWVKYIFVLSAFVCGFNALYEFFHLGIQRVGIAINPIPYALYSSVLGLISLNIAFENKEKTLRILAVIAVVFSTVALILTDVRGVILFFPLVAFYLILRLSLYFRQNYLICTLIFLFSSGLFYFAFEDKINERINTTVTEVQYLLNGNYETSIGARLELWEKGINLTKDQWGLGLGKKRLKESINEIENSVAAQQPHLHNQLIDTYTRYGVFGLVLLIVWLFSSMLFFEKQGKISFKIYPLISAVVLMIFLAGLTDVPFHHTHLVYFYIILVGVILKLNLEGVEALDNDV